MENSNDVLRLSDSCYDTPQAKFHVGNEGIGVDKLKHTVREIGQKIRTARLKAELTLSDLAEKTGLAESSLSRIERGYTAVSVTNLVQICEVLSIGLEQLLDIKAIPSKTRIAAHGRSNNEFEEVESTGYLWKHLVGGARFDVFNVFHLVFPRDETMKTLVSHAGQEYCYVLKGEVTFYVGDELHRLKAGSGILIDSELPHRAERVGDAEAHMLMIVTRSGAEQLTPEWWNVRRTEPAEPQSAGQKPSSSRAAAAAKKPPGALSGDMPSRKPARRSRA
jgi:transcriptional regulator with XRE-family HTH domain